MFRQENKKPITAPLSDTNSRALHRLQKLMGTLSSVPENPHKMFHKITSPSDAKTDKPLKWPHLPTLSAFHSFLEFQPETKNFLNKTLLLAAQHNLGTTGDMYEFFQTFGLKEIVSIGKDYSTHPDTVKKMMDKKITCIDYPAQTSYDDFDHAYSEGCSEARRVADDKIAKSNGEIEFKLCLDDGGKLIRSSIKGQYLVAVEQTTSGLEDTKTKKYPIIEVASSSAKTQIEPQLVADITVERLEEKLKKISEGTPYFRSPELRMGIVGLGHIGLGILESLIKKGKRGFILHDKNPEHLKKVADLIRKKYAHIPNLRISTADDTNIVLGQADVILGCTGVDITKDKTDVFNSIDKPKILASCSSRAIEFHTLLRLKAQEEPVRDEATFNPLKDIEFKNGWGEKLFILQAGKPLTFNQTEHALPPKYADLVRTLLSIGVIQAKFMQNIMAAGIHVEATNYKLSPTLVRHFTQIWRNQLSPADATNINIPEDIANLESVKEKSGGSKIFEAFEIHAKQWLKNMEVANSLGEASPPRSRM